jgi:hypothetical protein
MSFTITTDADTITRLVDSITPLAGEEGPNGALNCVVLDAHDGHLTLTASNRFIAAQAALPVTGDLPHAALVDAGILHRAAGILRAPASYDDDAFPDFLPTRDVTITIGDDTLTITALDGTSAGSSATAPVVTGKYPDAVFAALTADTDVASTATTVVLDPEHLRQVTVAAKAVTDNLTTPIRITPHGEDRPALIEAGTCFVAAIMPKRINDQSTMGYTVRTPRIPSLEETAA